MTSILDQTDVGTGHISPEQRLFVGVIVAAVMDATGGVRGGDHGGRAAQSKANARAWFVDGGDDFQTVCTLAGFEPEVMRNRVLAYLDRATDRSRVMRRPPSSSTPSRRPGGAPSITMKDIAAHAGVSVITVARVLDGMPIVSEYTAARVLASVNTLGYVPSFRGGPRVH